MNHDAVLVTGGAGFIGSHLCDRLVGQGREMLCQDNFVTGSKRNIHHLPGNRRFELIRHDITPGLLRKCPGGSRWQTWRMACARPLLISGACLRAGC